MLVPAAIALITMGYITYILYINADRVECTPLWCNFITERHTASINITQDCDMNGEKVPCGFQLNISNLVKIIQ